MNKENSLLDLQSGHVITLEGEEYVIIQKSDRKLNEDWFGANIPKFLYRIPVDNESKITEDFTLEVCLMKKYKEVKGKKTGHLFISKGEIDHVENMKYIPFDK